MNKLKALGAILVIVSINYGLKAEAHDAPCLNTNTVSLDTLSTQECMLKTADGWIADSAQVTVSISTVEGSDLFVPLYPTYRWDGSQWIKTMEVETK